MKLTVLGKYGTFPKEGGACSGYLIEHGDTVLLLDCGNGVLSRLQRLHPLERLDAIVLSHLHDDHCGDLRILKYAVETKRALGAMSARLHVHRPASPVQVAEQLDYTEAFVMHAVNGDTRLTVGELRLGFARMEHSVETYAVSIESGSTRLVYSADTTYHSGLIEFARGADVLLCEATTAAVGAVALPHLTAGEAGLAARTAGVGRLLLTHVWCDEREEDILREARRQFAGAEVVEEMRTYVL